MVAVRNIKNAAERMNKRILLIVLSAVILALAFSSFNLQFLAWFAFVPFFFALEGKTKLQSFSLAYLCGFLFFTLSMYWLSHVTIAGWVILSLYQALYFGIFGLAFFYFSKTFISYFTLSAAWVVLEYIRSHIGGGIGWNLLGYSQYKNLPVIQIADITGAWGVSFLVMLMSITIYAAIKMIKKHHSKTIIVPTFIVLILSISTLCYGYFVITSFSKIKQSSIKISVVQGNIPQQNKWDEKFKNEIIDTYKNLTIQVSEHKPDLIIWPETAVPGALNHKEELMYQVRGIAKRTKTNLLVGAPMVGEQYSDKYYNSAILFSGSGDILTRYDKLHSVAFGEFVPFEDNLPFLRNIFPPVGNFASGGEYTIFKLPTDFGVLICFEDIFPELARELVKKGANFITTITNDAWFGKTCAAYQHAAASVFRAVENRRPFIRSANTGFSCFIDKTGKIYAKVSKNGEDLFIQGMETAFVNIDKYKTFTIYTKYGNVFILFCAIMLVGNITKRIFLTI